MSLLLALVLRAVAAPCDAPASAGEVTAALEASEALFAKMDVDGFVARTDELLGLLPCLDGPLESPTVARVHRVRGVRAFVDRDADLTVRAFAAARRLEPDYQLAESLVPPAHPLRQDYVAMDPGSTALVVAPRPKEGRLTFDGLDTLERPADLPTVLQRYDRGGAVQATAYLLPGDPLPDYPARKPPHPLQRPLTVVTGAAATLGAGLLVGAVTQRTAYDRLDLGTAAGQDRLDPLRARTNALVTASAVAGALTLASGTALTLVVVR